MVLMLVQIGFTVDGFATDIAMHRCDGVAVGGILVT